MDITFPLLLDGATGTELQKRGMPRGVNTEGWILEHPAELVALQRGYVDAGARVLTAPTFGTTAHLAEDYAALVALSRQGAGGRALVAGDLGPGGEMARRVAALCAAGVDLYLVETMLSVEEARAAVEAVRVQEIAKPVLVSFYPHGGLDVWAAYTAMEELGVAAFGFNCAPPEEILAALEGLPRGGRLPLLAMPGFEEDAPPQALARYAAAFAALGVEVFGGCCGTNRSQISCLAREMKKICDFIDR